MIDTVQKLHCRLVKCAGHLQSFVLLAVRLGWGYSFFLAGKGKLEDIDKPIGFFGKLGIPFPTFNAYLASTTELVGGLLLMVGLASRLTSIPLAFTMVVAYLTAHRAELLKIFSEPSAFIDAGPFFFLIASLVILAFGPGKISLDFAIDKFFLRKRAA
jgi:putative oxidoreductase